MLIRRKVDPSEWLVPLKTQLAKGKHLASADAAVRLSQLHADNPTFMRELVEVLADALRARGDNHSKRGRPPKQAVSGQHIHEAGNVTRQLDVLPSTPEAMEKRIIALMREQSIERAGAELYLLEIAEAHLRNKKVSSHDLAGVLWHLNEDVLEGTTEGNSKQSISSMSTIIDQKTAEIKEAVKEGCHKALRSWGLHNKQPKTFRVHAISAVSKRYGLPETVVDAAYHTFKNKVAP